MYALGWAVVFAILALVVVNAAFMMISSKAWFRLPRWILAKNDLITERKYSSGLGALEIRITGGMLLGAIGWVLYHALR